MFHTYSEEGMVGIKHVVKLVPLRHHLNCMVLVVLVHDCQVAVQLLVRHLLEFVKELPEGL